MNILKEKNLEHKIFKEYDKINNILEIFRFSSPDGYMVMRRSDENFAIDFFGASNIKITEELKTILAPYLKADLFISLDKKQNDLETYFNENKFRFWFSDYDMIISEIDDMKTGNLVNYNGELNEYSHIFGKAFMPLRKLLGFKDLNFAETYPKLAKKWFEEANAEGSFYGYEVNKIKVGASTAEGNVIDQLAIAPEYQGKGYGREMLKGIVKDMLTKYEHVRIGAVEINTKAYHLYTDVGFKVIKYEHHYVNYKL